MDSEFREYVVGEQLGNDGFDQLVERAKTICECERQRIELANQLTIIAKKAEYAALFKEDKDLEERLYQTMPPY
jgi:hypothetical protein